MWRRLRFPARGNLWLVAFCLLQIYFFISLFCFVFNFTSFLWFFVLLHYILVFFAFSSVLLGFFLLYYTLIFLCFFLLFWFVCFVCFSFVSLSNTCILFLVHIIHFCARVKLFLATRHGPTQLMQSGTLLCSAFLFFLVFLFVSETRLGSSTAQVTFHAASQFSSINTPMPGIRDDHSQTAHETPKYIVLALRFMSDTDSEKINVPNGLCTHVSHERCNTNGDCFCYLVTECCFPTMDVARLFVLLLR